MVGSAAQQAAPPAQIIELLRSGHDVLQGGLPGLARVPALQSAKGARAKPTSGLEDVANSTHGTGTARLC